MHRVNVQLHELFSALSDPYRVRIVRLLLEADDELCLCELSEALQEPEYKLSRHIKVLRSVGLLESVREGKWIYHSLIKNQGYFKAIHRAVCVFPDSENVAPTDLSRLKKRILKRQNGRCTTPSKVTDRAEKRA